MAPRKTQQVPAAQIPPAGSREIELANLPGTFPGSAAGDVLDERGATELDAILDEIGSDWRIRVWHIIEGKPSYGGELAGEGFSLDALLENFGGGEKTLKIYQGTELKRTTRVSLDPTVPPTSPRQQRLAAERRLNNGAAPVGGGVGDVAGLLAAMGTAQLAQVQMMQTMMAAQQRNSADMMAQSQQTMTAMITAMTAMLGARKETDPLDTIAKVAEIMRPKEQTDIIGTFEKGLRIGQTVAGAGNEDSVMPIIGEGVKALGALVEGIVTAKKAEAAATMARIGEQPPIGPPPAVPPPVAPRLPGPVDDTMGRIYDARQESARAWLAAARQVNFGYRLVDASAFMKPERVADIIVDGLSDEQFDDLIEDILDQTPPGFGARLVGYFPELSRVAPEYLGGIVRGILESVEDGPEEPTTPGDASNAPLTTTPPASNNGAAQPPILPDVPLPAKLRGGKRGNKL